MNSTWKLWLHGLLSAFINGAVMAILSRFIVPEEIVCWTLLLQLGSAGGVLGALNHLRQSPLPKPDLPPPQDRPRH